MYYSCATGISLTVTSTHPSLALCILMRMSEGWRQFVGTEFHVVSATCLSLGSTSSSS